MFFDHPRPGKIQGACFRVFPLNPILLGRGIFAFRNFRFWQTSCSGEQRVTLTTRSISTASLWRTTRVGRALQQGTPCPISAEFLGTNTTEGLFSWFLALLLTMFQGTCRTARTSEVRRPPIPPRPRGARSPHNAVAPVTRGWPAFLCAPWQMGHEAGGNPSQPRVTGAAAPCGY